MSKTREIVRLLLDKNLNIRETARACRLSSATAHKYAGAVKESGITWTVAAAMPDDELEKKLFPEKSRDNKKPLPDFNYIHKELRRKGKVTLQLLWEEYNREHPDGYSRSQYCELYRKWKMVLEPVMRLNHVAGEKLYVDFSGDKPCWYDPKTGEQKTAELFVAALGASSYSYALAVPDQTSASWLRAHVKAFEFLGGCPEKVVPDNLKSGVTDACFYDPELNPAYADLACHYGVVILPARPWHPRDKAKVESAVLNVERRILASLRDRRFFSLEELNAGIAEELRSLNERPFQGLIKSRKDFFEELDKQALRPLPDTRYSPCLWKKDSVGYDYHVEVGGLLYSVPYTLIGKKVTIRYDEHLVEIFCKNQRVACFTRSNAVRGAVTNPDHMPYGHREYLEWTPDKIRKQAETIGPGTVKFIERLLTEAPSQESGFRSALGTLRLSKTHGKERLELACIRLQEIGACRYKHLKSILERKLESTEQQDNPSQVIVHENLRGGDYYAGGNNAT